MKELAYFSWLGVHQLEKPNNKCNHYYEHGNPSKEFTAQVFLTLKILSHKGYKKSKDKHKLFFILPYIISRKQGRIHFCDCN